MTTTNNEITDDDIRALHANAGTAGDHAQAMICDIALGLVDADAGYDHLQIWSFLSESDKRKIRQLDAHTAREACVDVIAYGRGEADADAAH